MNTLPFAWVHIYGDGSVLSAEVEEEEENYINKIICGGVHELTLQGVRIRSKNKTCSSWSLKEALERIINKEYQILKLLISVEQKN